MEQDLKTRLAQLKEERGHMPFRDSAQALGVSEAALLNACRGDTITRLRGDFKSLLECVPQFGRIMGLVRNDNFIAMPIGEFSELTFDDDTGHAKGGNIDFNFDLSRWASAFALKELSHGTLRRMIQIFDDGGAAVLKIVLWSDDGNDAFDQFVEDFKIDSTAPLNDTQTDEGWQAFHQDENTSIVANDAPERTQAFLQACIDHEVEISLRIPTRASSETYCGPLRRLEPRDTPGWIDLRYPHFTTHFGVGAVAKVAVPRNKEGGFGQLTLLDAEDSLICQIACADPEDTAALDAWSTAVASHLMA